MLVINELANSNPIRHAVAFQAEESQELLGWTIGGLTHDETTFMISQRQQYVFFFFLLHEYIPAKL